MAIDPARPLILTARMDAQTHGFFQNLRTQYFPPERNIVPAHLTLFHHLPPSMSEEIHDILKAHAACTAPLAAQIKGLRFLGRGVAYDIESVALHRLRADLAERWHHMLIPQDQAALRAHVTVQNKTSPDKAKACLAQLQASFVPRSFYITGLDLWRYEGGPWAALKSYSFRASIYSG